MRIRPLRSGGDGSTRRETATADGEAARSPLAPLWIDTDVALGAPTGNVDDGLALAAVLAAGAPVLGISVVAGNVGSVAALAALEALVAQSRLPAAPPLLAAESAAERIATLPAGASLLALGPLTHVAAAARMDPGLPSRVTLRLVATVTRPWRAPLRAITDLNRRRDTAAARLVLALPWRELRVFPLDVVGALRFGRDDLDRLAREAGPLGAYLARASERWLLRARWRQRGGRFRVSDLVAALDAIGELQGARFDGARLAAFDAAASRERFHALVTR